MDTDAAGRVIALFEGRGKLDRLDAADANAARACLDRAKEWLSAASVLIEAKLWESQPTSRTRRCSRTPTRSLRPASERFRQGRHESEYFDPARPVDKTGADASWAVALARRAIDAVGRALSAP